MSNNNLLLLLVVLVLFIYLIVRQFTEQQVNIKNLLLLPLLSAYGSYTELPPTFAHFPLLPLLAGLVMGVAGGLATGVLRGRYTGVRLDSHSGHIYAKPQLISSCTWLVLLIVHISIIALSYSPLEHTLVVGTLIAFTSALFLVSISIQKLMVYMRYNQLLATPPQQPYGLR